MEWQGILAALFSAILLGGAPILAKRAYQAGADPTAVVILRTGLAALALWALYLLHPRWRRYLYIYPVGLLGCLAVGFTNALGSVFYYLGLYRLDAAIAHLIYSMYPILVAAMGRLNGDPIPGLTRLRMLLASLGLVLLLGRLQGVPDLFGVLLVLLSSGFYALHVVLSQRVLYEMPAQTLTLYALTAMAAFTPVAGWVFGSPHPAVPSGAMGPIFAMAAVLMLSRLGMFMGVKRLGGDPDRPADRDGDPGHRGPGGGMVGRAPDAGSMGRRLVDDPQRPAGPSGIPSRAPPALAHAPSSPSGLSSGGRGQRRSSYEEDSPGSGGVSGSSRRRAAREKVGSTPSSLRRRCRKRS